MPERSELSIVLEEIVARAVDEDAPRPRCAVNGDEAPATTPSIAYRAARKAYHVALGPQLRVNDSLASQIAALQGSTTASSVQLGATRAELAATQAELAATRAELAAMQASMARTDTALERLRDAIGLLGAGRSDVIATLDTPIERLDDLYEAFELEYRGSVEVVTERLRVYLDHLFPRPDRGGPALDLGCGRGEWLTLLRDMQIEGRGIDLNPDFVDGCRGLGLDVRLADLRLELASIPADSIGTVTAFHLVEHLDLSVLVDLVDQAARVLQPGGQLVMETPNPTNLAVGAAAFYRDPTHRRPVHPDFLAFLARHCGFDPVQVIYLHPVDEHLESDGSVGDAGSLGELGDRVRWALAGPQDFAVVATKPAAG